MQAISQHIIQLDGRAGSPNKKFDCPACGQKRCFRRYFNYDTRQYIDDSCGICDRQNKCGWSQSPKEYYALNPSQRTEISDNWKFEPVASYPTIDIPYHILESTLNDYENNSFIKGLIKKFDKNKISEVIGKYYLGTYGEYVTFPFIDELFNIRAIQVKLFDANVKTVGVQIGDNILKAQWLHKLLRKDYFKNNSVIPNWLNDYNQQDKKVTCFFGQHLLREDKLKTVALVEAPKTAIIASMVYPNFIWIATSSLSYLTKDRCKVLSGRRVILFPDCGIPNPRTNQTCLEVWQDRIASFSEIADFEFSTLLEDNTTEEQQLAGYDLADFLLEEISKKPIEIYASEILSFPSKLKTNNRFGYLIVQSLKLKDGTLIDVLTDSTGEFITEHASIKPLAEYFNKNFVPCKIDGLLCLIHIYKQ